MLEENVIKKPDDFNGDKLLVNMTLTAWLDKHERTLPRLFCKPPRTWTKGNHEDDTPPIRKRQGPLDRSHGKEDAKTVVTVSSLRTDRWPIQGESRAPRN